MAAIQPTIRLNGEPIEVVNGKGLIKIPARASANEYDANEETIVEFVEEKTNGFSWEFKVKKEGEDAWVSPYTLYYAYIDTESKNESLKFTKVYLSYTWIIYVIIEF